MSYRDILTPVLALADDEAALVAAGELAEAFNTQATALIVAVHLASVYHDPPQPLSRVLHDIAKGPVSHAAQERAQVAKWLERAPERFIVRDLTVEGAVIEERAVAHARVADLVVLSRAGAHQRARRTLIEDVLFKSGRPVLIVPREPKPRTWKCIVIGWNASAEAARAVAGAMPLLRRAERVVVATVDAMPRPSGHAEAPGSDLAAHLARHDVRVEVHNLDGMGRSDARALLDEAMAADADLLVLGAYGRSRAEEFIFGGVTRELLEGSPLPLLMAH